jgi:hypothetical protein
MTTTSTAKSLCECGCGETTTFYKGEYRRFVKGHNARHTKARYEVDANGCWVWQYACNSDGYGVIHLNGKSFGAHRHYYTIHRGAVPEGLQLDHLCRNRACVNPSHLEPVTSAENSRRSSTAKLTHETAEEIRSLRGRVPGVELARRFGVSKATISRVWNGGAWTVAA